MRSIAREEAFQHGVSGTLCGLLGESGTPFRPYSGYRERLRAFAPRLAIGPPACSVSLHLRRAAQFRSSRRRSDPLSSTPCRNQARRSHRCCRCRANRCGCQPFLIADEQVAKLGRLHLGAGHGVDPEAVRDKQADAQQYKHGYAEVGRRRACRRTRAVAGGKVGWAPCSTGGPSLGRNGRGAEPRQPGSVLDRPGTLGA